MYAFDKWKSRSPQQTEKTRRKWVMDGRTDGPTTRKHNASRAAVGGIHKSRFKKNMPRSSVYLLTHQRWHILLALTYPESIVLLYFGNATYYHGIFLWAQAHIAAVDVPVLATELKIVRRVHFDQQPCPPLLHLQPHRIRGSLSIKGSTLHEEPSCLFGRRIRRILIQFKRSSIAQHPVH